MKEKTYVEDIDRSLYDFRNEDKDAFRLEEGLTEEIVLKISEYATSMLSRKRVRSATTR